MRSRGFQLDLDSDDICGDTLTVRSDTNRKQYSRGRSAKSPRRRSSRTAGANVPLGISGRRNRRWSW